MKEELYKRHRIYSGKAIGFSADEVLLPNGKTAVREYIEHPGAVAVLTFVDEKRIILVKQYRYPVREITYEIPAGKLDGKEKPLVCVKRELAEETGYAARRIQKLGSYWPTPAFGDEVIHIYAARDLRRGHKAPDEDEFIDTLILPFSRVLGMVRSGRIKDSKTIIAVLWWARFGK